MSEFDQLYREVILDHYKNPRGHGVMEHADAEAEGQNPLCGDEVSIYVAFGEDGDTIDDVMFAGPRLRDQPGGDVDADRDGQGPEGERGRGDAEGGAARGDRHPADAGAAQVRDPRPGDAEGRAPPGEGHAAARGSGRASTISSSSSACRELDVCPVEELPPGGVKIVRAGARRRRRLQHRRRATTRSRTAARTTTGRSARASSSPRRGIVDLPAPRREVRHPHGTAADAAGVSCRSTTYPVRVVDGRRRVDRRACTVTPVTAGAARRSRPRRADPPRGGGRATSVHGGLSPRAARPPGGADDGPVPVRARCAADRVRDPRDRRLARLLDDLARGRRPDPRRQRRSRSSTTRRSARPGGATSRRRGSTSGPTLVEGDAIETLRRSRTSSTSSSSTPRRRTTSGISSSARRSVEPGALVVADNVLSHEETLGAYSRARQADPTLVSADRAARPRARAHASSCSRVARVRSTAERRWSGLERSTVRAVEVPAGRGVSPRPEGGIA